MMTVYLSEHGHFTHDLSTEENISPSPSSSGRVEVSEPLPAPPRSRMLAGSVSRWSGAGNQSQALS